MSDKGQELKQSLSQDESLREELEHYRALCDVTSEAIALHKEGKIIDVNETFCAMFGYEFDEVIGMSIHDFSPPEMRETYSQLAPASIEEPNQILGLKKDGTIFPIEVVAKTVHRDNKKVRVAVVRDVTKQKQAEEALRASEERYRAFIANSSEGIVRYDLEPSMSITLPIKEQMSYIMKNAVLKECNHLSAKMYGFSNSDEIIGLRLEEVMKTRGAETVKALREFILSGYRLVEAEISSMHEEEARRYFMVSFMGFVEEGMLVRAWGTQREITKQKRAELQIEAHSKQLRALSARVQAAREEEGTRIAREIHDELGTALTGLKWDLEWIEEKLNDCSDDKFAKAIREKISSTEKLIDNTLEVVRRIASELRPKLLDDLGLITAIEWYAAQFQKRTGIICKVESEFEDIELSREKTTAIYRIFQEVLTNVLRHAQASHVDVRIGIEEGDFILEAKDDGKGITEELKNGAGSLGILGMKERAYLIGGEVLITGQEGKGTCVKVFVPIA